MHRQVLSSFEYFKQKRDLANGVYEIIEHDDSVSIVILSEFEEKWMSVQEFEDEEHAQMEEMRWINDGMDLLYPED